MAVKLFNTLSRSLQDFVPLDPAGRRVGMYCCGPTVYDFGHIGNFRTFVFADLLRRYLRFRGYEVRFVMNITDVEDKILQRVRQSGGSLRAFTSRFEGAFLEDMKTLGCLEPDVMPRATEHMGEILSLIAKLLERGIAYRTADGSVYFSIEKYRAAGHRYGQLVHLDFDRMRPGARVQDDEYKKESVADFALWKARVPEDGEVFWPAPWGEGRPGWHIECSAMSMKHLGPSFDLHVGGEDLVFPHHEDEIAQSEGAGVQVEGRRFVKHWVHGAHLLVQGKKMAKSLGNFLTPRDLLRQGYRGREIRQLLISAHYRETFNFTMEGLEGARAALARLDECLEKLGELAGTARAGGGAAASVPALEDAVVAALDEDLNVAAAWAAIFEWVREANRQLAARRMNPGDAAAALEAWGKVDNFLGLGPAAGGVEAVPPGDVLRMLEERQAARQAKDFARADALRQSLKAKGWVIEDTPKGPKLKPV